jgi:hypothetical protein
MKRSHDVDFDALFDSLRDERADDDDDHGRAGWSELDDEDDDTDES